MVKALLSILLSLLLIAGAATFEGWYVQDTFDEFSSQLQTLYRKIEEKSATRGDAEAVRTSWNEKKKSLHVWIPHNDISYIDYWLSEGLSLTETGNFDDARGKIEVLLEISRNIPAAYAFSFENIF